MTVTNTTQMSKSGRYILITCKIEVGPKWDLRGGRWVGGAICGILLPVAHGLSRLQRLLTASKERMMKRQLSKCSRA